MRRSRRGKGSMGRHYQAIESDCMQASLTGHCFYRDPWLVSVEMWGAGLCRTFNSWGFSGRVGGQIGTNKHFYLYRKVAVWVFHLLCALNYLWEWLMKSMTKGLCSNKVFDFNYLPCKAPIPKKSGKKCRKVSTWHARSG